MHQRDTAVVVRHMGFQPADQPIHVGNPVRFEARYGWSSGELPLEVTARLAEITEAHCLDIDIVQGGQRRVHRVVDRRALVIGPMHRQRRIQKMRPSRNSMT